MVHVRTNTFNSFQFNHAVSTPSLERKTYGLQGELRTHMHLGIHTTLQLESMLHFSHHFNDWAMSLSLKRETIGLKAYFCLQKT